MTFAGKDDKVKRAIDVETYAERMQDIDNDEKRGPSGRHLGTIAQWHAHCERLRLIYAPFPVVRRFGTGSALPWAGTIVGNMSLDGVMRGIPKNIRKVDVWRETGDGMEWDDYATLCGLA